MSEKPMILIAEDEPDAANLLGFHLNRRGYRTVVAGEGRAVLNQTFEHMPDLIILDLIMPNLHGYEVCRLLRSAPATCRIPIIMVTAMSRTEDKVRGFKLGADDYITKPYEMAELLARVGSLLHRSVAN